MGTIVEIERKKGMTYKAEIRRKGHRPLCRTFKRKTDAQRWINEQENTIDKGGLVTMEVDRKTISNMIQRFRADRVYRMGTTARRDYNTQLSWWNDKLGHLTLRHLTRAKSLKLEANFLVKHSVGE